MEEAKKDPTPLTHLGEFGLIKHLTENIKLNNPSSIKGIGDDAAIIKYTNSETVISTDMLVEGVHFDLLYTPLKHLGYKSVMVNLSDIYAMNAVPEQILVSIAVSNRMSLEALDEIYEGINLACNIYGVDLIGGDTTSSLSGLVISITAIGKAEKDSITYRNGAKENDLICVSGDLGAAYIGLQILEREKSIFKGNEKVQPDFSGKDYILERQLKPEARKGIIEQLAKNKIKPNAMIDISDGLSSELLHISEHSSCGVQIFEDKLPIDTATIAACEELNINPTIAALNGGEDYELLFTVPLEMHEKIKEIEDVRVIGHITDINSGNFMVGSGTGSMIELSAQGWQHK